MTPDLENPYFLKNIMYLLSDNCSLKDGVLQSLLNTIVEIFNEKDCLADDASATTVLSYVLAYSLVLDVRNIDQHVISVDVLVAELLKDKAALTDNITIEDIMPKDKGRHTYTDKALKLIETYRAVPEVVKVMMPVFALTECKRFNNVLELYPLVSEMLQVNDIKDMERLAHKAVRGEYAPNEKDK